MMQPRPGAGCKHDVVRIALALQEDEQRLVAAIGRDVFGEPEAEPHVEFQLPLHVRHQNLEMIDTLRHGAAMMLEIHQEPRLGRHGGAEFQRHTARIADVQRLALVWPLHPLRRQAGLLEIVLRFFKILLGEAPHADALGFGHARTLEHQRVMARLGDPAQIDRILVLVADDQADQIDIKGAALRQILDVQHRVAGAGDVERWIVVGLGNAHEVLPTLSGPTGRAVEKTRQLDTPMPPIHSRFVEIQQHDNSIARAAAAQRYRGLRGGLETIDRVGELQRVSGAHWGRSLLAISLFARYWFCANSCLPMLLKRAF